MTARERVLEAYGGKCAWCGKEGGPFELDHIEGGQGQGNRHRAILTKKIEYWLVDQFEKKGFWPPLVQVLCEPCHSVKSGRRRMPPTKDTTKPRQMNIAFPPDKADYLEQLAKSEPYGGSKSKLLEVAFDLFIERQADHTVTAGLQQQLSQVQGQLAAVQETLLVALKERQSAGGPPPAASSSDEVKAVVRELSAHVTTRTEYLKAAIREAYASLEGRLPPAPAGGGRPGPRPSRWRLALQALVRG